MDDMNYMIFAGQNHYPGGGMDDFICYESEYPKAIQSLVLTMSELSDGDFDSVWGHIYDITAQKKVYDLWKYDFQKWQKPVFVNFNVDTR